MTKPTTIVKGMRTIEQWIKYYEDQIKHYESMIEYYKMTGSTGFEYDYRKMKNRALSELSILNSKVK
jgi:hypothetical protein